MEQKKLLSLIDRLINYIKELAESADSSNSFNEMFSNVLEGVFAVNRSLFGNEIINCFFNDCSIVTNNICDIRKILDEYDKWRSFVLDTIEKRDCINNYIDRDFDYLMDYVKYVPKEVVRRNAINSLLGSGENLGYFQNYYQYYPHLWGTLDVENGNYEVIDNRVNSITSNHDRIVALYNRLGDYRSKLVLTNMMKSWLYYERELILGMKEANFPDYYDSDILKCNEDEVMVDIGAFDGDSAEGFIKAYGKYKKIYCYEITPETIEKLSDRMSKYPNIIIKNKGVSDTNGEMYIDSPGGESGDKSDNQLLETGSKAIEIVKIDDDITESVSIIKMDIEGAEMSALKGCKRHIENDKPKLLICVYHNNTDIVDVPDFISQIRDDYTYYLRSNGDQWGPAEIVLFAL